MTRTRALTAGVWLAAVLLVVLAGRVIAYALADPTPLRASLRHAAGGPRLATIALVSLGLGAGLAAAVLWLASVGVRERAALAGRGEPPRLQPLRVLAHAVGLTLVSCGLFAALESYLHLRAGLAWHGFSCLTGPVHVAAVPILGSLSALAAAVLVAARHVFPWMRRTLGLLVERPHRATAATFLVEPAVEPLVVRRLRPAPAWPRPPPPVTG